MGAEVTISQIADYHYESTWDEGYVTISRFIHTTNREWKVVIVWRGSMNSYRWERTVTDDGMWGLIHEFDFPEEVRRRLHYDRLAHAEDIKQRLRIDLDFLLEERQI